MKYYNIQTVSQMCGLSTHCIRAWEKRYGAIKPARSDNGRRLYSELELNRLLMLGKLSALGNSISLIANLPDKELEDLLEKMTNGRSMGTLQVKAPTKSLIGPETYLNNLFMALHAYKLDILTHELNKASMDLTCKEFALDVVAALFRKVGEYVHTGRMNIAQEHTLSAITKFFIGRRIAQHYRSDNNGKLKITLATPKGEYHSIGLMLASLLMAEHNLNFVYLGENLPEESIADAAKATNSDIVLLAISPAYRMLNKDINSVASTLRKNLPESTQIWIGGAIQDIRSSIVREAGITTFDCLANLDKKLEQIREHSTSLG
jgi:DNA-binding transcriptional MerR regulator/methylmalonyl-CoA mutase cobalamin-binding subunit